MTNVVEMRDAFVWRDPTEELAHAEALAAFARRLHVLGPIQKRMTVAITDGQLSGSFTLHYQGEVDALVAILQANRALLPSSPTTHEG